MLAKTREFFRTRHICEVDCPMLSPVADVAAHIDLVTALYNQTQTCYLIPSPEYGMKKLLSEGMGDIYQLSHVFRDGECSSKHNPEFTMIEWYRVGMRFEALIAETMDLMQEFLGDLPRSTLSYREAFLRYAGFDYLAMNQEGLLDYIAKKNISTYPNIENETKDDLLNLILASIEPEFGKEGLCALTYYPSTQAALAQTVVIGDEISAERFEIYYQGIELCNGYHELTDAFEQRLRLIEGNQKRLQLGKKALPIDEEFLSALEKGLPDCCGVAVGFDRLMMLRHRTQEIADVIPFAWERARPLIQEAVK